MSTVTCTRCGRQTGIVARRTGYCPNCANETYGEDRRQRDKAGPPPEYEPIQTEPCERCGGTGQEQFASPGWTRGEVPGRIVCVVLGLSFLSLVWLVVGFVIGHLCR